MKTEEDEAFDDIARRQGAWGGGFKAKQAMAADKLQEPYCWTWDEWMSGGKWRAEYGWKKPERQATNLQPLYTTPLQRQWVGLTDEEKGFCAAPTYVETVARIEAKLKEKNT